MSDPLLSWYQQFMMDRAGAERRLVGKCVLVYEPPVQNEGEDFQFQTSVGVLDVPIGGSEPLVAIIEKSKNNAFQRRVTIGRTSNNDIEIADASVSRFHAWLERNEANDWQLCDAGSRNGTQVSGRRIEAKLPQVLTPKTQLKIGGVSLTFHSAATFFAELERRSRL